MFPFQKEQRAETDKKMVEMMKKEAGKVLQFRPVETNILANRARKLAAPDQYIQGLRKNVARGRRLK